MKTSIKKWSLFGIGVVALLTSCNKTPEAGFDPSETFVNKGETVEFTNTSINAKTYEWDFGDGTTSVERHPDHTYTEGGTYEVKLTAYTRKEKQADVYKKDIRVADIWSGPSIVFSKADMADWTLAANQDQITSTCHITRANNQGIFNIAMENTFSYYGPTNTLWALGSTSNLENLIFNPFMVVNGECPPCIKDQPMVLQIVDKGIYIDLTITAWTEGGAGGGFTYTRSTQ